MLTLAFDFDQTITAAPDLFEPMMQSLHDAGHHIVILTGNQDIQDNDKDYGLDAYQVVVLGLKDIPDEKAAWCRDHDVDLLIDNNAANVRATAEFTNAATFYAKKGAPTEQSIQVAFSAGYARHGSVDEIPDSVLLAYESVRLVIEDGLAGLSFAEAEGTKQGIYTQVFLRRDRLWQKYDRQAAVITRRLSLLVPAQELVDTARTAGEHETDVKERNQKKRDALYGVLLRALHSNSVLVADALAMAAAAHAEATAEGITTSYTLLHPEASMDDIKSTAHAQAVSHESYGKGANPDINTMVGGIAGDLIHPLQKMQDEGESDEDQGDNAVKIVAAGVGFGFYLDNIIQQAYGNAQLEYYRRQAKAQINWITMGDDRVCPACMAIEAGNPYSIDSVPVPPDHGGCRCILDAA